MPDAKYIIYYILYIALLCYTSKGDSLVELAGSSYQLIKIIWQ